MEQKQQQQQKQPSALAVLNSTANGVIETVNKYVADQVLVLPPNYAVGNAIKSAQLIMQDDAKIMACTPASIHKSLMDMAISGLSPSKGQCYFIPYGNVCKMSMSYFGLECLAKRIDHTIDKIFARTVRGNEVFEFETLPDGFYHISKHSQTLDSMQDANIKAGYCTIVYNDGKPPVSLIMTWERIKKSWLKSPVHPVNADGSIKAGTTHADYTDDMIARTVIAALTKHIIRASDDQSLFVQTVQTIDVDNAAAEAEAQDAEAAVTEQDQPIIDADYSVLDGTEQ